MVRWQSYSCVIFAAALSLVGGCFNSPDLSKITCTSSAHCPAGYTCVRPSGQQVGLCEQTFNSGDAETTAPVDGAVAPDVATPSDGLADRAAGNFDQGPTNGLDSADASAVGLDGAAGVDDVAQRSDLPVGLDAAGGGNDMAPRSDTTIPDALALDSSLPDAPIQTPDAALTCPATCVNNDGCCPAGCNANTDNDCKAVCNNGVIEPGETCDPLSSCTAASQACVSDLSTVRTGKGDAKDCTFVCQESTRQCGAAMATALLAARILRILTAPRQTGRHARLAPNAPQASVPAACAAIVPVRARANNALPRPEASVPTRLARNASPPPIARMRRFVPAPPAPARRQHRRRPAPLAEPLHVREAPSRGLHAMGRVPAERVPTRNAIRTPVFQGQGAKHRVRRTPIASVAIRVFAEKLVLAR